MAVRDVSLGLPPPVSVAWTRRRKRDPTIIQSSLLCFPLPLSGAVSGLLYVQGTLAYRLPRPSGLMYQCSRYPGRNLIIALTINRKRSYFQCLIMKLIGTGPITSNPPPLGSIPHPANLQCSTTLPLLQMTLSIFHRICRTPLHRLYTM